MFLVVELQELFARNSARVGQQALCVRAHGLGFDDGLGVVVIVFELENVHQRALGGESGDLAEKLIAALGQDLLHLVCRRVGHVGIAAVRQELGGLLTGGSVQHAPGPLVVEQSGLPGAQHGRQAQIRFFFR